MPVADIVAWAVLVGLLVAITVVDARSRRIPDALALPLAATGLVVASLPGGLGLTAAAFGVAGGGAASLAVALAFRWWRGIDGLGMGDVKFLAAAGAWTGWDGIGPLLFVASTAALLSVALLALLGKAPGRLQTFAFGPFLCLGLLAVRAFQSWTAMA